MRDGDKLPYWPAMMLRKTAIAYCDMSASAFLREVATGSFLAPIILGAKRYWSRGELDKAIDRLFGDYEIERYDWRKNSPLYADDPKYHPELCGRKKNVMSPERELWACALLVEREQGDNAAKYIAERIRRQCRWRTRSS